MKIIPQENLSDLSLPLPIYNSIHIADAIGKDGEEFSVFLGLIKKHIDQLRRFSLNEKDTDLQDNTSDRARFGEGSYEDWYAKNRTPFCLIHKRDDILASLAWFGPEPLFPGEKDWHTVGWRAYPPFRGKGLMKNFINFVSDIYIKNFKNIESPIKLWVAIRRNNMKGLKLAVSLGFEISEEASDDISAVMVK